MYFGTEPVTIITKYYRKLVTMVTKCNNIGHHGNTILNWLPWKRNTDLAYMVTKYNGIHYHGYTYGNTFRQPGRVSFTVKEDYTGTPFDNLVELVLHLQE